MKPILKSEIYTCPKCHAYFEVEQGEMMPGYCKWCESEFDEQTPTCYKLLNWLTVNGMQRVHTTHLNLLQPQRTTSAHSAILRLRLRWCNNDR